MEYIDCSLSRQPTRYGRPFAAALLGAVILIAGLTSSAQAQEDVAGVRWGSRITAVEGNKVTVKLMMATGNCIAPPMECTTTQTTTGDQTNFSSSCTSGLSKYGTAGEQHVLTAVSGTSYQIGRDVDVWVGDNGPSFNLPGCITAEW